MADAKDLLQRHERMMSRQSTWRDMWQDMAETFLPNQADFTTTNSRGRRRGQRNYENSHRVAARNFAATIGSFIGPQQEQELNVLPDDEEIAEDDAVRLWLDDVRRRMWRALSRTSARYSQAKAETDLGLVVFGTAPMFIGENRDRNGMLFRSHHLSSTAIGVEAAGDVNEISLTRKLTGPQAAAEFKLENLGERTREAIKQQPSSMKTEREFEFVHMILPREDRDARRLDNQNLPFASAWIDKESEHIIKESGFHEFPFVVPRWETTPTEIYGRSPSMLAYADARTLQAITKTLLTGGQRAVDPPVWFANDAVVSAVRTYPGGTTIVDGAAMQNFGGRPPLGVLEMATNVPLGREMQNDYRLIVQAAFFRDLFASAIQRPGATATEILERKDEMVRVLGPTFGRLEEDYVGKLLIRVFNVMERAGAFPERPELLRGREIRFSYFSPFQQARRASEALAVARALEMLAPMAQIPGKEGLFDHFDEDAIARDTPELFGFTQKYIKPLDQVEGKRQERQAALQAQQVAAFAGAGSEAYRNVADAEKKLAEAGSVNGG